MENNTTDRGWTAMRTLLDREMPQKSRRRGMVWWWLLLVSLAGYGGWQWLHNGHSNELPMQENTQPIASSTEVPSKPMEVEEAAPASIQTTAEVHGSPVLAGASRLLPAKARQKAEIHYAPGPCRNDAEIFVEALPRHSLLASAPNNPSLYSTDGIPVKLPEPLVSLQVYPTEAKIPIQIPTLNRPLKPFHNHWAFGATSTISTEEFNAINGFSTGVTVDWHFARKWGIRSGLFYNIHTPQKRYRPVATVPSSTYTSNIEGSIAMMDVQTGNVVNNAIGNPLYSDSLSAHVYIPVTRLERLEIPISAFWQATPGIKVLGGFTLTRTLLTQADHQNYSGAYVLSLNDQEATDGASKLSTHELDNWHADLSLGAGLRLGKSFELALTAKMPLKQQKSKAPATETTYWDNGSLSTGGAPSGSRPVMALSGTLYF